MKQILFSILFVCTLYLVYPQDNTVPRATISSQLKQFSPIGSIYLRNLGMNDRNRNGVIDECRDETCECQDDDNCEGFNQFVNRFGIGASYTEKKASIDCGFHANGVIYGTNNGCLEEPEIINFYQINIRFKDVDITDKIESEQSAHIYANNIPLVWLDDESGTVMTAVTRVLGEGWNEREVSEDEAVRMFNRAVQGMRITGRTGDPGRTGYYTLPEMVNRRAGFCFEVALFGYWFFSELKINSLYASATLSRTLTHGVIQLYDSKNIVDYFGGSRRYNNITWEARSPLWSISQYYASQAEANRTRSNYRQLLESAVLYDKYNLNALAHLAFTYDREGRYQEIGEIGDFIFEQIDLDSVMTSTVLNVSEIKNSVSSLVLSVLKGYFFTNNRDGHATAGAFLRQYFGRDNLVLQHLNYYRF